MWRMCWKPDWMFCSPCTVGDLPWQSEVSLPGGGCRREPGVLKEASPERPGWLSRRPPCFPFLTHLLLTLILQPTCVLNPGFCLHSVPTGSSGPAVLLRQAGGIPRHPEKKGKSPKVPYSLASESKRTVSAEMLTCGRAQN